MTDPATRNIVEAVKAIRGWTNNAMTRSDVNIEIIKAAIFWRYRPGLLPAPWHLDAGAGLAYFSEQQRKQGRPLGNDVLFDAELGLAR